MRKLALIITLVLVCGGRLPAQTSPVDRGSWAFSGQASYISTGTSEAVGVRLSRASVTTSAGRFVTPGWLLAGNLALKSTSLDGQLSTSWAFGPEVKRHFRAESEQKLPGARWTYFAGWLQLAGLNEGETKMGALFGFGLGFVQMMTRTTALDFELFVEFQKTGGETLDTYGLQVGVSFFVWE